MRAQTVAMPNQRGWQMRFIALHIDYDGVFRPAEPCGNFSQPVSAGRMIGRSHAHRRTKPFGCLLDTRIVGRNNHLDGPAGQRPLIDMLDQRATREQA